MQNDNACKIWDLLVDCAKQKTIITYREIYNKTGVYWRRPQPIAFKTIRAYCSNNNLPSLSIIAVNKKHDIAKEFRIQKNDSVNEIKKVFDYNWNDIKNPFTTESQKESLEDYRKEILLDDKITEKYEYVKIRTDLQTKLRNIALIDYSGKCAMCSISIPEILEGCHIKPYSDCNSKEKGDQSNILLLCRNHHKLFDEGLIYIDENYIIHVSADRIKNKKDHDDLMKIDGKKLSLPEDQSHYPGKEYIHYLNSSKGN